MSLYMSTVLTNSPVWYAMVWKEESNLVVTGLRRAGETCQKQEHSTAERSMNRTKTYPTVQRHKP